MCSDMERKKTDRSGHHLLSHARDTPFAPVTPHFSSARELTGTKLAMACVKKVQGIYLYVPCRLHICAHGGPIYGYRHVQKGSVWRGSIKHWWLFAKSRRFDSYQCRPSDYWPYNAFLHQLRRKAYICKEYEPVLLDKIYIIQHLCKRRPRKHHRPAYLYLYLYISNNIRYCSLITLVSKHVNNCNQ